ncbi:MAG: hypothetical protein E4H39_02230 [Syntrophobacterales bacterium]|nr:MAG: hypothetical protein E4H39_02230 [Syntrophobacterales bacterium]
MGSKQEGTVLGHKAYFEAKLEERRSYLTERGVDHKTIAKDDVIKKIKAKIKETNVRIKAIAKIKRRTEELAKIKAERLAAPKIEKGVKGKEPKASPETGKEKKKKKKKEAETEG